MFGYLFAITVLSFSAALGFLIRREINDESPFSGSMLLYLWSMFGNTDPTIGDEPSIVGEYSYVIVVFGFMLYAVIVLTNLLIAMMGNTYSEVKENADREWK